MLKVHSPAAVEASRAIVAFDSTTADKYRWTGKLDRKPRQSSEAVGSPCPKVLRWIPIAIRRRKNVPTLCHGRGKVTLLETAADLDTRDSEAEKMDQKAGRAWR